jgi:hypothetical protein
MGGTEEVKGGVGTECQSRGFRGKADFLNGFVWEDFSRNYLGNKQLQ